MKAAARRIWWIARHDLTDIGRQRGTWFSLFLFPVLNVFLILVLPGILTQREQAQQDRAMFTVGVEATSAADAALVRDLLRDAQVRVVDVERARVAVSERDVHVAVMARPGAAESYAGDGSADLRVIALTTRNSSSRAYARVAEAIEARRVERAVERADEAGLPEAAVRPLSFEAIDVADSARGAQLTLALTLPLLVLLPLTSTIGIAAQRVSGGRDTRVVEPLLLLPVARHEILGGKALSAFFLSLVAVPATTLPLVLARFVPVVGAGRPAEIPATTIAGVAVTALVVLVVMVAVGVCAGAIARTSTELSTLLPYVTFPIVMLAMALQFVAIASTPLVSAIPIVGPTLLVRDIAGGIASPLPALVATTGSLVTAVVLIVIAARTFGGTRSVLRPTR